MECVRSRRWGLGERRLLGERRIRSLVGRKREKSKGYLGIRLSVVDLTHYLICYHGLQIENIHLLFQSLRLEKQENLI